MYATRPTLYGARHAVSAGHYLAAAAGFAVLEAGGNAIDAGVPRAWRSAYCCLIWSMSRVSRRS